MCNDLTANEILAVIEAVATVDADLPGSQRNAVKLCAALGVHQILRTPYNSEGYELYVLRDDDDRVRLVIESSGTDTVLDPMDWATEVQETASDNRWDDPAVSLDQIERNAPGGDPGVHTATGLSYGDEERHVCARHNERAQAELYREIMEIEEVTLRWYVGRILGTNQWVPIQADSGYRPHPGHEGIPAHINNPAIGPFETEAGARWFATWVNDRDGRTFDCPSVETAEAEAAKQAAALVE